MRWERVIAQALLIEQISGRKQHVHKTVQGWVSEDSVKETRWH